MDSIWINFALKASTDDQSNVHFCSVCLEEVLEPRLGSYGSMLSASSLSFPL
ncbi:hypothetical protein RchiOBHm_Chr3g0449971 [Rosa chinensis]|uniref:Uncharacterized protein n=1 Tax=Rosa chinensis TaxID=74649 RepID=A0A2P6R5P0_ROSCH|nr:hypothetical protein RchiOBHm_Chr3g0449971 [Rosa chinensis]